MFDYYNAHMDYIETQRKQERQMEALALGRERLIERAEKTRDEKRREYYLYWAHAINRMIQ